MPNKVQLANPDASTRPGEKGFTLLALIVVMFIILLTLSIAAPRVARDLRRDREVEAVHRGNQYVRAIQLYYRKFGHYPGSMDQLEKSNNIRFLRKRYDDPLTGKDDWRIIPVGQNQTTVKGFFGQPLAGIATTGLGSAAGLASGAGAGGSAASSPFGGASSPTATPGATGAAGAPGAPGAATGATGATGTPATPPVGSGFGTSGIGAQPTTFSGTGAPFMGVGLNAPGDSIVEPNEQTTYATWEFLYDPRIELLKQKAAALGGAVTSGSPSSFGAQNPTPFGTTPPASSPAAPGTTTPGTAPTTPTPTPQ
jgi:type II secretory pathway pseudopilin PulG